MFETTETQNSLLPDYVNGIYTDIENAIEGVLTLLLECSVERQYSADINAFLSLSLSMEAQSTIDVASTMTLIMNSAFYAGVGNVNSRLSLDIDFSYLPRGLF